MKIIVTHVVYIICVCAYAYVCVCACVLLTFSLTFRNERHACVNYIIINYSDNIAT